ncbi:hypothetical protein DWV56_12060 [Holdemanella biformis]|uniref:SCP domain-containing protein n=1 Tax=Holdemanella biformis TaxID=1735 RepID=A0A413CQ55_9FIRM|nr:CAP domain-containing protein [Holdemanella biformis]RGW71827.1 hypothetical protein DWV56_12060 [Holdemanella biformis]
MKNRNKTLTSLAAASMVLTQVGQMSVFAKEEPMKNLSDTEEVSVEKTQKELLEEQIKNTLDNVNEAKKKFDEAQEKYETYNKNDYALAVSNRDLAQKNYLSAKDDAQEAIVSALEKQIQELEANQKALKDANDKKKWLESRLKNANEELKQAQDDLIEQQKKYESLLNGSSKEQIEQSVNELKTQLESATLAYQEVSNRVNELLNAKQEAEAKVLDLQNTLEGARVELSNAKGDVVNAQNAYDVANADYNEKLEIYNGASDPELKAEYEKQVVEAKNNLTIAQSDLQNAKLIQQSKVDAVANAESCVVEVENEICDLKSLIDAKENELLGINESIGITEKELSAVKEELTNAIEIENSMEEVLNKTQIALDKAKKEVEAQQTNVDKAQSDVDAQQKIVNQLRVDKEQVSQKISLGSKGFFEAYGYTNALKVLEENSVEIGKYTEVGAENDATSLANFKKAIAMVKTGNALRTTDDNFKGLNPLKVSAEMFAISQVQVNQMAKTKYGHTKLYRVSENAAVEYEDPFVGWYTEEKAVYDYLHQKGWDINDIRDSQGNYIDLDKANEIVEALNFPNIRWVQVGHYTNMLNSKYNVTGTAWIEGKTSNGYSRNSNQVFYRLDTDSLLTIDEFESQFNEYYDSLMNADGAYEDANVILNQLKGELYKQNALLTQKTNDQKVTEQNKVNAENKLNSAKNEVGRLESVVRKKQKNLDDLCSEESTSNIVNEIQNLKTLKSNKESLDLVVARQEVENVKKEMAEANVNVNNKEAFVKNAQMELDKRNEILEESNKGKEIAHNNLKISEAVFKEKGKVLADTKKIVSEKQSNVNLKESEMDCASELLDGISKDLSESRKAEEIKKVEMNNINENYEVSLSVQNRLNNTSDSIYHLNTRIQNLNNIITEMCDSITVNDLSIQKINAKVAELESIKLEIEDVKAEFDSFIANHPLQSNKICSGIVESLYEKIDVMKEAYRNYEEALKAFEDADMLNSENVKALELASKNYTLARLDLENANNNLKVYLENVEDDVEIKEKESVNTATETELGLYSLSGVLGLAGLALAGKKMKREEE